jgi:hypothetical protein
MGSLGDNLLKLTEFPFSYSFIGLLLLISGGGGLFEDASLERIGPLLILMGFVATTLSISDPVGRLQKALLVIGEGFKVKDAFFGFRVEVKESALPTDLQKQIHEARVKLDEAGEKGRDLREKIREFQLENSYDEEAEAPPYDEDLDSELQKLIAAGLVHLILQVRIFGPSLSALIERMRIPIRVVVCLISNFQFYRNKNNQVTTYFTSNIFHKTVFENLEYQDQDQLAVKIRSLKRKTVDTIWVTREIDKITSMGYFIIVVATFIYAILFLPNVVDTFVDTFQAGNQTRDLAIQHINAAIAANEVNDLHTTRAEVEAAIEALRPLVDGNGDTLWTTLIISIFAIVALGAVSTILIKRARELQSKCLTTFKFLVLQNAIKIKRDTFEKRLEEIRQFLVDGDWTLAEVEVERLMEEYDDLVSKEWLMTEKKETSPEETKSADTEKKIMVTWKDGEMKDDTEKKVMIKWKNGEMTIEEMKDKE